MRMSQLLAPTLRETPGEAEVVSHRLMLRADFIRRSAAGMYTYLPLAWRVLRKIEQIVREEMDAKGGQELLMPIVQPAEIWRESGRWDEYGDEMFRLQGPPRAGVLSRTDPRRTYHDSLRSRSEVLSAAAAAVVPNREQVSGRSASSLRIDARA